MSVYIRAEELTAGIQAGRYKKEYYRILSNYRYYDDRCAWPYYDGTGKLKGYYRTFTDGEGDAIRVYYRKV